MPNEEFWKQIVAIIVILLPLLIPIIRYILNLGTVQSWIKKQKHGEVMLELAVLAVNSVEAKVQQAKKKDGTVSVSSADKLQMAVDFVLEQGKLLKLPQSMMNEEMIKASIESQLAASNAE